MEAAYASADGGIRSQARSPGLRRAQLFYSAPRYLPAAQRLSISLPGGRSRRSIPPPPASGEADPNRSLGDPGYGIPGVLILATATVSQL